MNRGNTAAQIPDNDFPQLSSRVIPRSLLDDFMLRVIFGHCESMRLGKRHGPMEKIGLEKKPAAGTTQSNFRVK